MATESIMPHMETRNKKIRLWITLSEKRALLLAACAVNLSITEFVLESSLARVDEILPDRQRFGLSAKQWEAFQAALSAPPRPSRRLAKLLKERSVFERGV
jgi:uncharacterized protein (DUF1778 family)